MSLRSELDEQGLQVVVPDRPEPARVVDTVDVSVCSPLSPKWPQLRHPGAHFVGLDGRSLQWRYFDLPTTAWVIENWNFRRPEIARRVAVGV